MFLEILECNITSNHTFNISTKVYIQVAKTAGTLKQFCLILVIAIL